MGIYLALDIHPCSIEPEQWAETYDQSLRLLRAHPAGLLRLGELERQGLKRLMYTRELESDAGTREQHWHVVGDRKSARTGESFVLYRDLSRYRGDSPRPRKATASAARDVAVALHEDTEAGRDGRGLTLARVLSAKTQGFPFHIPLVGVLALVEERHGRAAFAHGDVGLARARGACSWASRVLGRTIPVPSCVRADALADRLASGLVGDALRDACLNLYRGPEHEMLRLVHARAEPHELERWFAMRLAGSARGGPHSMGALQTIETWLHGVGDFERIVRLACLHPSGPRFDPVELARVSTTAWFLQRRGGASAGITALIAGLGIPVHRERLPRKRVWPAPRDLGRRLGRLFPSVATEIEEAIAGEVQKDHPESAWAARGGLDPRTPIEQLLPRFPKVIADDELPQTMSGLLLRVAGLTAHDTAAQAMKDERVAKALGRGADAIRMAISRAAQHQALLRETWAALDEEQDQDFLRFVLGLLVGSNTEPRASACRILLWDLPLCRRLHLVTQDPRWRRALEQVIAGAKK